MVRGKPFGSGGSWDRLSLPSVNWIELIGSLAISTSLNFSADLPCWRNAIVCQSLKMSNFMLAKIVSGGQTGVDQAALAAAIAMGVEHGGWCPAGRRSERGRIPAMFQLTETFDRNYTVRTEKNVMDSDATMILFRNVLSGGTLLTERLTLKHDRPCLCVNLDIDNAFVESIDRIKVWLDRHSIETLNVAGPRESTSRGIQLQAEVFLKQMLAEVIA